MMPFTFRPRYIQPDATRRVLPPESGPVCQDHRNPPGLDLRLAQILQPLTRMLTEFISFKVPAAVTAIQRRPTPLS
jgi:hypothetical protein